MEHGAHFLILYYPPPVGEHRGWFLSPACSEATATLALSTALSILGHNASSAPSSTPSRHRSIIPLVGWIIKLVSPSECVKVAGKMLFLREFVLPRSHSPPSPPPLRPSPPPSLPPVSRPTDHPPGHPSVRARRGQNCSMRVRAKYGGASDITTGGQCDPASLPWL
jgi:hypothetical protein